MSFIVNMTKSMINGTYELTWVELLVSKSIPEIKRERATLFSIEVKDANYLLEERDSCWKLKEEGEKNISLLRYLILGVFLSFQSLQASLLSLMKHDLLYWVMKLITPWPDLQTDPNSHSLLFSRLDSDPVTRVERIPLITCPDDVDLQTLIHGSL